MKKNGGLYNLEHNDDLFAVIKKCNYNFEQLSKSSKDGETGNTVNSEDIVIASDRLDNKISLLRVNLETKIYNLDNELTTKIDQLIDLVVNLQTRINDLEKEIEELKKKN